MSDSFSKRVNDENFDAERFFIDECRGTEVKNERYPEIEFPKGWSEIVKDFISKIKMYKVKILSVSDFYYFLDIAFESETSKSELNIRRAIDFAREKSQVTCGYCGKPKYKFSAFVKFPTIKCDDCLREAGSQNHTGTWLDKF